MAEHVMKVIFPGGIDLDNLDANIGTRYVWDTGAEYEVVKVEIAEGSINVTLRDAIPERLTE